MFCAADITAPEGTSVDEWRAFCVETMKDGESGARRVVIALCAQSDAIRRAGECTGSGMLDVLRECYALVAPVAKEKDRMTLACILAYHLDMEYLPHEALELAAECAEYFTRMGWPEWELYARQLYASVLRGAGQYKKAVDEIDNLFLLFRSEANNANSLLVAAKIHREAGNLDRAIECGTRAVEMLEVQEQIPAFEIADAKDTLSVCHMRKCLAVLNLSSDARVTAEMAEADPEACKAREAAVALARESLDIRMGMEEGTHPRAMASTPFAILVQFA